MNWLSFTVLSMVVYGYRLPRTIHSLIIYLEDCKSISRYGNFSICNYLGLSNRDLCAFMSVFLLYKSSFLLNNCKHHIIC